MVYIIKFNIKYPAQKSYFLAFGVSAVNEIAGEYRSGP
jgi:hypothetical protein